MKLDTHLEEETQWQGTKEVQFSRQDTEALRKGEYIKQQEVIEKNLRSQQVVKLSDRKWQAGTIWGCR